MVKVAVEASGNIEGAANMISQLRHMVHTNMPGARATERQGASLEGRSTILSNYIKAHDNPCEGIRNLCYRQLDDHHCSFLTDGSLEKETLMLTENPNTFISKEMFFKDNVTPFYVAKGQVGRIGEDDIDYDSELTYSVGGANRPIVQYIKSYQNLKDDKKRSVDLNIKKLSESNSLIEMQKQLDNGDDFLINTGDNANIGENAISDKAVAQYIDSNKFTDICGFSSEAVNNTIDDLWELDISKMENSAERILLEDGKKDSGILNEIIKEDISIKLYQRRGIERNRPTSGLELELISCQEDYYKEYVVLDGDEETIKLEKDAAKLTGALPIIFSNDKKTAEKLAIKVAKGAALRALSSNQFRPDAHTCLEGMDEVSNSKSFEILPAQLQLDIIRHTTSALGVKDTCINSKDDFSLWDRRVKGAEGSLDSMPDYKTINAQYLEASAINDMIDKCDDKFLEYKELLDEGSHEQIKEFENSAAFTGALEYINKHFDGININKENCVDFLRSPLPFSENIFWNGVNLYPKNKGETYKLGALTPMGDIIRFSHSKANPKDDLRERFNRYVKELEA